MLKVGTPPSPPPCSVSGCLQEPRWPQSTTCLCVRGTATGIAPAVAMARRADAAVAVAVVAVVVAVVAVVVVVVVEADVVVVEAASEPQELGGARA